MSSARDIRARFIDTLNARVSDFELPPLNTPSTKVSPKFHGYITKEEFTKLIEALDKLPPSDMDTAITTDDLKEKNYADLLWSKVGFHHIGSSDKLIERLGIADPRRNSLLGGHSILAPPEGEALKDLRSRHKEVIIKDLCSNAMHSIRAGKIDAARQDSSRIMSIDKDNPNAIAIGGICHLKEKNFDASMRDLENAMGRGASHCGPLQNHLAEAISNLGQKLYFRRDHRGAMNMFARALQLNPNDAVSKIHMELCEQALYTKQKHPFGNHTAYRR